MFKHVIDNTTGGGASTHTAANRTPKRTVNDATTTPLKRACQRNELRHPTHPPLGVTHKEKDNTLDQPTSASSAPAGAAYCEAHDDL